MIIIPLLIVLLIDNHIIAFTSITFMSLYFPYGLPPMAEMLPPISNSHMEDKVFFDYWIMSLLIVLFYNHIEWHSHPLLSCLCIFLMDYLPWLKCYLPSQIHISIEDKVFSDKCSFIMPLLIVLFTHNHIEWHSHQLLSCLCIFLMDYLPWLKCYLPSQIHISIEDKVFFD